MKKNVRIYIWVDVRHDIRDNIWSIIKQIIIDHVNVHDRDSVWDNISERAGEDIEGFTKSHIMHHLCKSTDSQLEAAYQALERL